MKKKKAREAEGYIYLGRRMRKAVVGSRGGYGKSSSVNSVESVVSISHV